MELWQRSLLGKQIPQSYYHNRDQLERKIILENLDGLKEEQQFLDSWKNYDFPSGKCAIGFKQFWQKKNKAFKKGQ